MALNWFKKKKDKDESTDVQAEAADPVDSPVPADIPDEPIPGTDTLDAAALEDGPSLTDEETDEPLPQAPEEEKNGGLFSRLKSGLSKTRKILTTDIDDLFAGKRKLDDDLLEELEELLITSDIGVSTAMDLIETIGRKSASIQDAAQLKEFLKKAKPGDISVVYLAGHGLGRIVLPAEF